MADAKFTPGPWAQFRDAYGDGIFVDTAPGNRSDNDYVIAGQIHGKHREANAHLIAAAPDLYEALDRLLKSVRTFSDHLETEVEEAAAAALAKARGQ